MRYPTELARSLPLCFTIAFAATAPVWGFSDVAVRLQPIQPLMGEDFTIIVEGAHTGGVAADGLAFALDDLGGGRFEVTLRSTCPLECATERFRVELPVDGSTSPLAEDDYAVFVQGIVGGVEEPLFYARFAIGETFHHVLRPKVVLNPRHPTDNDHLQLLIPTDANSCGPSPPELNRIERSGQVLALFLDYYSGFGGGFATSPEIEGKCTPPYPFLDALPVDLGVLEAGTYRLDVYIQNNGPESLPVRTNRRSFKVDDAPDARAFQGGRFEAQIEWRDFRGASGVAKPVPGATDDSALFSFFGSENWEVLVKVLDGCGSNGHYWVLAAAASTLEYTITITDTVTGHGWSYFNPLGAASGSIANIEAFDCAP